jgi:hypothetical protein
MIMGLPNGLRKKMDALQSRIEAMARMFGLDHILRGHPKARVE